jgi:hypothetical protein
MRRPRATMVILMLVAAPMSGIDLLAKDLRHFIP